MLTLALGLKWTKLVKFTLFTLFVAAPATMSTLCKQLDVFHFECFVCFSGNPFLSNLSPLHEGERKKPSQSEDRNHLVSLDWHTLISSLVYRISSLW